jgi:hypothetical protein
LQKLSEELPPKDDELDMTRSTQVFRRSPVYTEVNGYLIADNGDPCCPHRYKLVDPDNATFGRFAPVPDNKHPSPEPPEPA